MRRLIPVFLLCGCNEANSYLPAYSAFPLAGWSDGLECNTQVQEEVRHLSALQAYLSLGLALRSDLREWPASTPYFLCVYRHSLPNLALRQVYKLAKGS